MEKKTKAMIAGLVAMALFSVLCVVRVAVAEEKGPAVGRESIPEGLVVEVLTKYGWEGIGTPSHDGVEPLIQEWRGHGRSFVVRVSENGLLEEVYHDHCAKSNPETFECDQMVPFFVVRERGVYAGEEVRVINGAHLYLNGVYVYDPGQAASLRIMPEEIMNPEWKPEKIGRTFKSVVALRSYAQKTRHWVVIGSPAAGDLLGWWYNDLPVHRLKTGGRTFLVFDFDMSDEEYKEWETGTWDPTHIKYHYLGIYWGGHDILYGPGCVSIFGFQAGTDTDDMDNVRMVELNPNGTVTYYEDPVQGFGLKEVQ